MVTPKDWESRPIGDFLEFKNGLNKGKEFFGYGTPIVNYMDVYHHRGLLASDIQGRVSLEREEIRRFAVRKGDVFFTRTSETPDEVGISSVLLDDLPDGVFSGFVLRGRPKTTELLPGYCKYCFSTQAVREAIIKSCTYTTRALTNGNVLSRIEILVPPVDEQRQIVVALDDIESLIDTQSKLVHKLKELQRGTAQVLFTTKKQNSVKLGFLGNFISGSVFPLSEQGRTNEALPFYKVSDLSRPGNETVMYGANHYVSYDVAEKLGCKVIPKDAIVFAKIGGAIFLERKRLTSRACCIDNNMMAMVPSPETIPLFLYYLLQQIALTHYIEATALPSLSPRVISDIDVTIPTSIKEQGEVVKVLSDMDKSIAAAEQELMKYEQIRQGMMHELLTGHIRLVQE